MTKKTVLYLFAAAAILIGCAKEKLADNSAGGDQFVTFNVSATSESGKAVLDGDGQAEEVNHWVMEVLDSDGDRFNYQEDDAEAGVLNHVFKVKLVKGQQYTVLFWADTKGMYDVAKLTDVKIVKVDDEYLANDDARDAFSAVVTNFEADVNKSTNVTLTRPFGQLNIIFTDLKDLYNTIGNETEYLKFKPKNLAVSASLPTTFNVKTQKAGAAGNITLKAAENYLDNFSTHREKETLFMNYVFASAADKDIVDLAFSFESNGKTISHNLTAIPFERNYRTNILGDFISSNATWNVTIDPVWTGEYTSEYIVEGSIAAVNKALKEGKTAISIVSPSDIDTPVSFPAESDGKEISIDASGVAGKTLSFVYEEGAAGPAKLTVKSDAKNLNINTPNTHVDVNTGNYSQIDAATSATTLVVGKGVVVETLNVTQGNIDNYGVINTINKAAGCVLTYYPCDAASLRAVGAAITATPGEVAFNGKVYVAEDIDLNNEEWVPINATNNNVYFDGQNHTISNLKVSASSNAYIGLFDTAATITIKNLTLDGVSLSYPESSEYNARGGALIGHVYGCVIENCKVKNVSVKANQKLGGLIGYIEGDTVYPITIKDCSAEKVSICSNFSAPVSVGVGGFIGHISLGQNPLIKVTGCSVKDVTIADFSTEPYSYDRRQEVCHVFIGNANNTYKGAETASETSHSIVLENNVISGNNTVLPTCIYSSDYFGWSGNAEETPTWKGYVYIDGKKWQPDYAFECGGQKYSTIQQALEVVAQSQDKTVRIIKPGQYDITTLSGSNCTVEATVEGVEIVHNAKDNTWISSGENLTVKNLTWTVYPNASGYPIFSGTNLENCTLNGMIFTHNSNYFKDCKFVNENGYNLWAYGSPCTFDNCEFHCPGGTVGGAINVYNEGNPGKSKAIKVTVKDCKFYAKASTAKYSALYIKPQCDFDIEITNTTADDNFAAGAISGSRLWNVQENTNLKTTVKVDGKLVYAKGNALSLCTVAQLQAFSADVNAGDTYGGQTVYLENDIDLQGVTWVPAGGVNSYPSVSFCGIFDGQGNTVANMTTSDNTAKYAAAGFFGSIASDAVVKNLKLTNVAVSSTHYAGAICAYTSEYGCLIDNCTVVGGTITSTPEYVGNEWDNGDKAGAIIGYAAEDDKITNCTVQNVTVKAYRDLGGIIGCANEGSTVSGCSVSNSVIIQDNTNGYKSSPITTYKEIIGVDYGATTSGNTYENVTLQKI